MTPQTQLPEAVLARIQKASGNAFWLTNDRNKRQETFHYNTVVEMERASYRLGAETEATRSLVLIQALRDLRHGLFKDADAVNECIDNALNSYNKTP